MRMHSADPRDFIARLEADSTLFEPDQLRRRMDALDRLDQLDRWTEDPSDQRAGALRAKLEAVNAGLYAAIRNQIRSGDARSALLPWIERCAELPDREPAGLRYDGLDELIAGVLQLHEPDRTPDSAALHRTPEMVFYQPTPVRHILEMLRLCALSAADVLIDLGSGLGHVPILASLLTGARCIGIEIEPAYVAAAQDCARRLSLRRVAFKQQDALEADLSTGTVFFLYTPFTGSILDTVLRRLRHESARRPIRICTFGPCTLALAQQPWLTPHAAPANDRMILFQARA